MDDNSYCANRWLWTIYKRFEAHHFQLVLSHKLHFNVFSLHQHSNQPLKRTKTTQGHKQKCTGAVKQTLVIKVNTANLDRFGDEITHHRPPAKNTSDRNRHSPWFPAKRRGERAQGAFSSFSAIMGCNKGKGWSERSESRGDLWITWCRLIFYRGPRTVSKSDSGPPGREQARRCVPLSSQTIGRVMASLRPFLFSLIRPPASEEPATTTISSIYQPHILERGAVGERAQERGNKGKVWVE